MSHNKLDVIYLRKVYCFFALSIIALTLVWGWKTSGVLENTRDWENFPAGYSYFVDTSLFNFWPIGKESYFYLNTAQGFLGISGTEINIGSAYEIYRTFYSYLLRTLWFIDPLLAVLLLDGLIWFGAIVSITYVVKKLFLNRLCWFAAGFAALTGQGFLHSVGEGAGHMAGYASGYFVLGLVAYLETWNKTQASIKQDFVVYAFVGVWQLAYGTAFTQLPFAITATWFRLRNKSALRLLKELGILLGVAFLPYLTLALPMNYVVPKNGVFLIVWDALIHSPITPFEFIKKFLYVLLDGFVSLGPLGILGCLGLLIGSWVKDGFGARSVYENSIDFGVLFRVILGITVLQFLLMTFLLLPLSGRGYATFNFTAQFCLGFAVLVAYLKEKVMKKYYNSLVTTSLVLLLAYPQGMKFGFRLPNRIFTTGLHNIDQPWNTYDLQVFK